MNYFLTVKSKERRGTDCKDSLKLLHFPDLPTVQAILKLDFHSYENVLLDIIGDNSFLVCFGEAMQGEAPFSKAKKVSCYTATNQNKRNILHKDNKHTFIWSGRSPLIKLEKHGSIYNVIGTARKKKLLSLAA